MAKRVLFTGHGGFGGHHCLEYFLQKTDWDLICLDSFRHKGTIQRASLVHLERNDLVRDLSNYYGRVKTYVHDLSVPIDHQLENLIFERRIENGVVLEKPIDIIINMASESAVERSTIDPVSCVNNNWLLAVNMLEFARKCKGLQLFVQISTDEVYGEASPNESHKEWDVIVPSNPYAASKAAQEALAISYWRTYHLPIVITNAMNLIGERQDPEKFLPKLIQKIAQDEEMPIYGDSETSIGSRVYLHAKCMADALIFLSQRNPTLYLNYVNSGRTYAARPDRYNICGSQEVNNLEMAKIVATLMGKELKYRLVPSESARSGYDRRYALNGNLLSLLGWESPMDLHKSLRQIINWTLENPHWVI